MQYAAASLVAFAASGSAAAADASIPTYSAVYQVEYKGKDARHAPSSKSRTTPRATPTSSPRAPSSKGSLKLASPNPVIERSHFRVVDGRIRPIEFWYEDGSRKGEDNLHVEFDWQRRVAIVSGEGARREVALDDRSLDRGSMQVALMRDMIVVAAARATTASRARTTSKATCSPTTAKRQTPTGIGTLTTRSFTQQREGSSRSTWLWFAPELSYLPVRIEQRRDGEVQTAFQLDVADGRSRRSSAAQVFGSVTPRCPWYLPPRSA